LNEVDVGISLISTAANVLHPGTGGREISAGVILWRCEINIFIKREQTMTSIRKQVLMITTAAVTAAVLTTVTVYAAQEPIVFPAKGQSNERTEQDKYSCYSWAKGQTGFDPMQAPTATASPPEKKGGVVKGAAGGALAGVAIGAIEPE
jgi:hypothetical protein